MRAGRFPIVILIILVLIVLSRTVMIQEARPNPRLAFETLTHLPNDELEARWSPDGQRIAFVAHQDGNPEVYMLDLASGAIQNISNSPRDDYNPRWSPDGQYLVYRERSRQSSNLDDLVIAHVRRGVIARLDLPVDRFYPVTWTADSERILFQSYSAEKQALYAYRLSTGQLTILFEAAPMLYVNSAPSPDGQWVLVTAYSGGGRWADAYLMNTRTGKSQVIVEKSTYFLSDVHWSPDSRQIAFVSGIYSGPASVMVFDLRSSTLHAVFEGQAMRIQLWGWSVDNRLAWITFPTQWTAVPPAPPVLYILEPLRFPRLYAFWNRLFSQEPVRTWMCALRYPSLIGLLPQGNCYPVRVMLDNLDIRSAAWSPTAGNHLAFTTTAGVYVMDADSGAFSNLIYGRGMITTVSWSPDGRHIAAYMYGTPWGIDAEFAVAQIRSGEVYLIAARTWSRGILDWAPDGTEFVYSTGRWGQSDVWRVALPASQEGE